MRTVAIITSVMLSLASTGKLGATEHKHSVGEKKHGVFSETQRPYNDKVANGNWGNVDTDDIALLLNGVVAEMSQYFPDRQLFARWYRKTPPSQREFVARAAAVFHPDLSSDGNQPKRTKKAF